LLSRASLNLRVVALKIRGDLCEHAFPGIKHIRVFNSNDGRFPFDYCKGPSTKEQVFHVREVCLQIKRRELGSALLR
jgi:hypothetical protein